MNHRTIRSTEVRIVTWTGRMLGDRGEGVISTAIAVLIIAFIGAGMWVAFNSIWSDAQTDITNQVNTIGS